MTNKERFISQIEGLFPIDSQFPETNAVGGRLLIEAIKESGFNWRELPDKVLSLYAAKCLDEDNRQTAEINRRIP